MSWAFDYVLDHHLNDKEKYPYTGHSKPCQTQSIGEGKVSLSGCTQVGSTTTDLTAAIRKQPVSVAFYVNFTFQFYHGGVFNPWFCHGNPNHGVLAVGFDLTGNQPFYKVKNSWGTFWGEKGYFRIAIGKDPKGTCNIAGHHWNYYPNV